MKKILGIVGSPRKNGNTHILVKTALEGAKQTGADTKLVMLNELTIAECDGCHACWETQKCIKIDDMTELYYLMRNSDGFVFGTPVYWYAPSALFKLFFDRFVFFNHENTRSWIAGKPVVALIPFEETEQETAAPVIAFFEKSLAYLKMPLLSILPVPGVGAKGDVLSYSDILTLAYKSGEKLLEDY